MGADPFNHQTGAGIHYHIDYLTPYWEPEGGFRFGHVLIQLAAYQSMTREDRARHGAGPHTLLAHFRPPPVICRGA